MWLTIATVDKNLFSGEAHSVTLPTASGELTVMDGHMPLVVPLKDGIIRVRSDKDSMPKEYISVTGVLEVTNDGVVVLL